MKTSFTKRREFPMTEENFKTIQRMAFDAAGIKLGYHKEEMIYGRLSKRVRVLGLHNFDEYCRVITVTSNSEYKNFVNSVTTNLTSFFRESYHFDSLYELLKNMQTAHTIQKKIRIWSAGCSKGMEPYSIAMTILKAGFPPGWDVKVLATDIDTNVLKIAEEGVYSKADMAEVDPEIVAKYFEHASGKKGKSWTIKERVKSLVQFRQLNLMDEWPIKSSFDIVFCRNVIIYFDKNIQKTLFEKFAEKMNPNGIMYIGNSETLANVSKDFKSLGQTTYQYNGFLEGAVDTSSWGSLSSVEAIPSATIITPSTSKLAETPVVLKSTRDTKITAAKGEKTEETSATTKYRILAIDDQLVMRRMLKAALINDFDVEVAKDGVEAYDMVTKNKVNYDLVITDLNMPNLDGIGLIKKLRGLKRYNGIPILVVSTESELEKKTTAKEAGASGWIVKPVDPSTLNKAANRLIK
ncbi:MAG: response regulator [Pseudomonadales bacterium]|nr:response regulator [Pseudomonadales bacterium]